VTRRFAPIKRLAVVAAIVLGAACSAGEDAPNGGTGGGAGLAAGGSGGSAAAGTTGTAGTSAGSGGALGGAGGGAGGSIGGTGAGGAGAVGGSGDAGSGGASAGGGGQAGDAGAGGAGGGVGGRGGRGGSGGASAGQAGAGGRGGAAAGAAGAGGAGGRGGAAAGASGSGGSPLPPVTDYGAAGPFPTMTQQNTGPGGKYTIVRPQTLGQNGLLHAPITFGPGIGMEVTVSEYRNGNARENSVMKITGMNKSTDVTMKRGVIGSLNLYKWLDQIRNGDQNALRTVTVTLQNESHSAAVMTWKLIRARIIKSTFGPFNAKGTDVAMEEMVVAYERMEMA